MEWQERPADQVPSASVLIQRKGGVVNILFVFTDWRSEDDIAGHEAREAISKHIDGAYWVWVPLNPLQE